MVLTQRRRSGELSSVACTCRLGVLQVWQVSAVSPQCASESVHAHAVDITGLAGGHCCRDSGSFAGVQTASHDADGSIDLSIGRDAAAGNDYITQPLGGKATVGHAQAGSRTKLARDTPIPLLKFIDGHPRAFEAVRFGAVHVNAVGVTANLVRKASGGQVIVRSQVGFTHDTARFANAEKGARCSQEAVSERRMVFRQRVTVLTGHLSAVHEGAGKVLGIGVVDVKDVPGVESESAQPDLSEA